MPQTFNRDIKAAFTPAAIEVDGFLSRGECVCDLPAPPAHRWTWSSPPSGSRSSRRPTPVCSGHWTGEGQTWDIRLNFPQTWPNPIETWHISNKSGWWLVIRLIIDGFRINQSGLGPDSDLLIPGRLWSKTCPYLKNILVRNINNVLDSQHLEVVKLC